MKISKRAAEQLLFNIARRNGDRIFKRTDRKLKERYGAAYGVETQTGETVILGTSGTDDPDGCNLSLYDLATYYADDDQNTPRERQVIMAIIAEEVV